MLNMKLQLMTIDLNEKSQEEMLGYVKKVTREISEKF